MEIIVVVSIIALALAVVMPRFGRLPRRLMVARSLSDIRLAFRETSMRARASGQPFRLVLNVEEHAFRAEPFQPPPLNGLEGELPKPNLPSPRNEANTPPAGNRQNQGEYKIPEDVVWEESASSYEESGPGFVFFPDGEASGDPLEFTIHHRHFRLDVDRLTGNPIITETDAY